MSGVVTEQGVTVKVNIIRLKDEPGWSLELENEHGTSTVWDDLFATDDVAHAALRQPVDEEGISGDKIGNLLSADRNRLSSLGLHQTEANLDRSIAYPTFRRIADTWDKLQPSAGSAISERVSRSSSCVSCAL